MRVRRTISILAPRALTSALVVASFMACDEQDYSTYSAEISESTGQFTLDDGSPEKRFLVRVCPQDGTAETAGQSSGGCGGSAPPMWAELLITAREPEADNTDKVWMRFDGDLLLELGKPVSGIHSWEDVEHACTDAALVTFELDPAADGPAVVEWSATASVVSTDPGVGALEPELELLVEEL